MRRIIIWDANAQRSSEIDRTLRQTMRTLGCHYELEHQSEPPFLTRMGLYTKAPVLEINGQYWTWKAGESIPEEAALALLTNLEKH